MTWVPLIFKPIPSVLCARQSKTVSPQYFIARTIKILNDYFCGILRWAKRGIWEKMEALSTGDLFEILLLFTKFKNLIKTGEVDWCFDPRSPSVPAKSAYVFSRDRNIFCIFAKSRLMHVRDALPNTQTTLQANNDGLPKKIWDFS